MPTTLNPDLDGPRLDLVRPGGEEVHQLQRLVALHDDLLEGAGKKNPKRKIKASNFPHFSLTQFITGVGKASFPFFLPRLLSKPPQSKHFISHGFLGMHTPPLLLPLLLLPPRPVPAPSSSLPLESCDYQDEEEEEEESLSLSLSVQCQCHQQSCKAAAPTTHPSSNSQIVA